MGKRSFHLSKKKKRDDGDGPAHLRHDDGFAPLLKRDDGGAA